MRRVEGAERLIDVVRVWEERVGFVRGVPCLPIPVSEFPHCHTLYTELLETVFKVLEVVDVCHDSRIPDGNEGELYQMIEGIIDLQLVQILTWVDVRVVVPNARWFGNEGVFINLL